MEVSLEKSAERIAAFMPASHQSLLGWSKMLASWLVLGNVGGLVLLLNLFAAGAPQLDSNFFKISAFCFTLGLGSAFFGCVAFYFLNYKNFTVSMKKMLIFDEIFHLKPIVFDASSNVILPEGHPTLERYRCIIREMENHTPDQRKTRVILFSGFILFLSSALSFIGAIVVPILRSGTVN